MKRLPDWLNLATGVMTSRFFVSSLSINESIVIDLPILETPVPMLLVEEVVQENCSTSPSGVSRPQEIVAFTGLISRTPFLRRYISSPVNNFAVIYNSSSPSLSIYDVKCPVNVHPNGHSSLSSHTLPTHTVRNAVPLPKSNLFYSFIRICYSRRWC